MRTPMKSMALLRVLANGVRTGARGQGEQVVYGKRVIWRSVHQMRLPTGLKKGSLGRMMSTNGPVDPSAHTSTTEKPKDGPLSDPEIRILNAALPHVVEHGWTVNTLAAGAQDIGYPSVAHGMISRGPIELVDFFMDKCNDDLRQHLLANADQLQAMSVTDRLKFGIRARLEMIRPVLSRWPEAMALGALPQNAPSTMKRLATLADEIWYFAGDKSTDMSWYTKRAVLTAIYASTELFMLTDESPDFAETWSFLDRRVEETIVLGEVPQNVGDVASMVGLGVQSMLSAVSSLAGPVSSQMLRSSPLSSVPNPISAIGNVVPPSVTSALASGLPNPVQAATSNLPNPPSPFQAPTIDPVDLNEIDQQLEKLGGRDGQKK